jgi:RNA polymerase sigma-70 factor (ECF subfamily)
METWRRFAEGDTDAFESLFREFHPDVYRWIFRMVRDHGIAEDLAVETFCRIYRSRATFDWTRSFQAWSRRIATNVTRDYLARRPIEVALPDALADAPRDDPAVTEDLRRKVRIAVAQLPPKHRIVAMLALVEEQSHRDIAAALDIPVGTVKSRLFHAVRLLRRKLRRLGIEP